MQTLAQAQAGGAGDASSRNFSAGLRVDNDQAKERPAVQSVTANMQKQSTPSEGPGPEGTSVQVRFATHKCLDEGLLDGMFSQLLEAGLADQELEIKFETGVETTADGAQLFFMKLNVGIDLFEKARPTAHMFTS